MKKSRMLYFVITLFFFVSGYGISMGQSDQGKPAESQVNTAEHTDHASHGAVQTTAQPATQPAGHAAAHDMNQMSGMEDMKPQEEAMATHMKTMQALMEKINNTENPAERKQLMAEHLAAMASGVKMMREMDDKMMTSMMKSGKCPMMEMMASPQGHAGMQGMMGNMPMCHTMMQKKTDRNFTMMEQIIESQKQLLKLSP
jgi:hypothetical protein